MMKESEYNELVEKVTSAANRQFKDKVYGAMQNGITSGIRCMIDSIPETTAQIVTGILKESGLLHFDD